MEQSTPTGLAQSTGPRDRPRPFSPGRPPQGRRFFGTRRRACSFCVNKITHIDYKNISLLRRHITDRAKIEASRRRSTCARHQRALSSAIKRARILALLPFTGDHLREIH